MDEIAFLTHQLENLFLKKIIDELRKKSMSLTQAKEYAQAFLTIEPFPSSEETYIKIMDFVAKYTMFPELKTYMNSYQKDKSDRAKVDQMREHIKQNNIDAALQVAKS